ncbi:MAG TPA: hypothetical protein VN861_14670 [Candidatus Acidoferrales bacterium]|jgi:hypothetical protein|nr:hypothetical protein [Candidatus Acidoferrales bacterium]
MTTYVDFGPQGLIHGALDTTGVNQGNWTIVIDQNVIGIQGIPQIEVYEMSITAAPGASLTIYKNGKNPRVFRQGFNHLTARSGPGEYLKPSDTLWLCFSDSVLDGVIPTCVFQLRADADHPSNKLVSLPGVNRRA